MKHEISLPDN